MDRYQVSDPTVRFADRLAAIERRLDDLANRGVAVGGETAMIAKDGEGRHALHIGRYAGDYVGERFGLEAHGADGRVVLATDTGATGLVYPFDNCQWMVPATFQNITSGSFGVVAQMELDGLDHEVLRFTADLVVPGGTSAEIRAREAFSGQTTNTLSVSGAAGEVRCRWELPFDKGWGANVDTLLFAYEVRRSAGAGTVQAYPPRGASFGNSALRAPTNPALTFITTAPAAPSVLTHDFAATYTQSWRPQGGWRSNNVVYQGSWGGWGPYKGLIWYDQAALAAATAGRTIIEAYLWADRQEGGVFGAQTVFLGTHDHATQPGGEPTISNLTPVGSLAVGEALFLPVPADFAAAIQANTAKGLGVTGGPYVQLRGVDQGWEKCLLRVVSVA
jgi:hypothetical protein